jgi:hypothetical protein
MSDRRRPSATARKTVAALLRGTKGPTPEFPRLRKQKRRTFTPEELERRRELGRQWADIARRVKEKAAKARAAGNPFPVVIMPVTKRRMTAAERRLWESGQ